MSCCAPGAEAFADAGSLSPDELRHAARSLGDGTARIELSLPAVHCGACIRTVEQGLSRLEGVTDARVNLSTRRVTIRFTEDRPPPLVETLSGLGYPPHLFDEADLGKERTLSELLRAVAVSGFAASNVMLLSVSVWSGADGPTRDLFHWISALIALPALVFAGRIFYRSAWSALRHGRMNMDVPIAIGVTMSYAMSLYETFNHADHAYFDAGVSLLFFLLVGRTLDHVMRDKARSAVLGLARLAPRGAIVIAPDGSRDYRETGEIEPGMRLAVAAGERICVDARVVGGASDLDCSLVNGESWPRRVGPGAPVQAGTLNLTGPLTLEATARAEDSFLAEMLRMMEAAEGGRTRYRRIADRVSSLYAPVVHLAAFLTFLGWMIVDGDWHKAITIAIAVLIITCPCALALAVPIVQVVAARRLFDRGVMVRDGAAMERLTEIDTVVFDKTGTLTAGRPRLTNAVDIEPGMLAMAAALGAHSRHPLSQAIARAGHGRLDAPGFTAIAEHPGCGMEGVCEGAVWRLGRADWALADGDGEPEAARPGTVLARDGRECARFLFQDAPRPGAARSVQALEQAGKTVAMLSGDTEAACREVADNLGIRRYAAALLPSEKVARIAEMASGGHRTLMVGDGLNDAPALAAAHVSMAPATAADIGRNAADFVFLHDSLEAVPFVIAISAQAGRLIRQNIGLALLYNALAMPIAILGYATPLIAAVAMSASSLVVIGNALRLLRTQPAAVRETAAAAMAPALAATAERA
ncbi:cation-translocating P-type ATPase [Bosea sp. (in: a-proteobacteria)]|uniref:cation-translocating P-type ATPase n=1 Tax=Bosea sp. (in: a-proteobacteria) TaxID=1871050 RepID=UPI003342808F